MKIQYFAAASLLAIFLVNIVTPPDFIIDILYLCSIVIVFRQKTGVILGFGITACMLIAVNIVLFDRGLADSISLWINRSISVLAIGIASYIAIHYRKQTKAAAMRDTRYLEALVEMLFMTSHQVRKPVANILGLIETVSTEHADITPDEVHKLCAHLKSSAVELDAFVRDLSAFIERAEAAHHGGVSHQDRTPQA